MLQDSCNCGRGVFCNAGIDAPLQFRGSMVPLTRRKLDAWHGDVLLILDRLKNRVTLALDAQDSGDMREQMVLAYREFEDLQDYVDALPWASVAAA